MSKLSIVAVNWWGKDWLELLLESVVDTVKIVDTEIFIVDNSRELPEYGNVKIVPGGEVRNHGEGLDYGVKKATGEYIFVIDIDAHFLLDGWDELMLDYFERKKLKLLACKGGNLKPIRPCGMLFKKDWFIRNGMSFQAKQFEEVKFDVGIHFYFKTLTLTEDRFVKFLSYRPTEYKGVYGSEYEFLGKRFLYHNYYGTRWYNIDGHRVHDKINDMTWERFSKAKKRLFKQYDR